MAKKKKAAKKQHKKSGPKKARKTNTVNRSAVTGEFVSDEEVKKHPNTTVTEKIR